MKGIKKSYYPLIAGLILVALALPAAIYLALTSRETRSKAASYRKCVPMNANCRFDIPCCSSLQCLKTNIGGKIAMRCLPGPQTPTVHITLSCVPEGGTISLIVGIPEGYPGKATRKCCEGLVLCESIPGQVGVCKKSCEIIPTLPPRCPTCPKAMPTTVRPTPWVCIQEGRTIPLTQEGFKMECCPGLVLCSGELIGIRGVCRKVCERRLQ